ncbi:hypothetical protein CJ307_33885, partial [Klebsiella quasipneumoniae]
KQRKRNQRRQQIWYRNGNAHYLMVTGSMETDKTPVSGGLSVTGIMAIFCDFSTQRVFFNRNHRLCSDVNK